MKSRREFFRSTALAAGALIVPGSLRANDSRVNQGEKKRCLRVAHITDVHVLDQANAEGCFRRVLSDINSMKDKPDMIINTGDTVMDENRQTREVVAARWKVWNKIVGAENHIPMHSALGNHDVWYGPDGALDMEYKSNKRYGKQWAMEMLSIPKRYYSFSKNGWKFVALDSINGDPGYQLDDEQFEWLTGELRASLGMPVLVFNHVPIISACALLYATQRANAIDVKFPVADMHMDHKRIKDLFFKHPNVKLALSGHVHYIDAVEYLGVKYLCNGAVSGNWWRDPLVLDEFPPVYSIIDLYTDGTSQSQLVHYNHELQ